MGDGAPLNSWCALRLGNTLYQTLSIMTNGFKPLNGVEIKDGLESLNRVEITDVKPMQLGSDPMGWSHGIWVEIRWVRTMEWG